MENLTLKLATEQIIAVITENPAESSTVIRTMLGGKPLGNGKLSLYSGMKRDQFLEKIGVVLITSGLPETMTVEQWGRFSKLYVKWWNNDVYFSILNFVNISPKTRISTLSEEEKMKIAIATAIAKSCQLLLIEPQLENLPREQQEEVFHIISSYVENLRGSVILCASHPKYVETITQDYILGYKGKIIGCGNKETLLKNFAVVRCSENQFSLVSREDYIASQKIEDEIQFLVEDRFLFFQKYPTFIMETSSLDEIMELLHSSSLSSDKSIQETDNQHS